MANLLPLRVTLIKDPVRKTVFPDWSSLSADGRLNGSKVGEWVDSHAGGWRYDKVENLGTGAPNGVAVALVPAWFADAAVALHPSRCSIMTEAQYQDFYENRAMVKQPSLRRDEVRLTALKAERDLRVARSMDLNAIDAEIDAALDPDNEAAGGVTRTPEKTYTDHKTRRGFTIAR